MISRKRRKLHLQRKNKRKAFRLSFIDKECTIRPTASVEPTFDGFLRDISSSGMKVISYEDLVGLYKVNVIFELEEVFSINGVIKRKKPLKNDTFEYGIEFVSLDEDTEQRLFKILWDKSREKVII